jgi:4a-hydroxytetrahydrobiopterin dehydratase
MKDDLKRSNAFGFKSHKASSRVSAHRTITPLYALLTVIHRRPPDMTETLAQKKCTPCRGGVPPLTQEEAERFQSQTPNWDLLDDSHRIERTFRFRNFQEALGFVRNVGDLAETEGHHPDISFGWGYATISLRTKKIKGLHENDFIMASKVDGIFDRSPDPLDRQ